MSPFWFDGGGIVFFFFFSLNNGLEIQEYTTWPARSICKSRFVVAEFAEFGNHIIALSRDYYCAVPLDQASLQVVLYSVYWGVGVLHLCYALYF